MKQKHYVINSLFLAVVFSFLTHIAAKTYVSP